MIRLSIFSFAVSHTRRVFLQFGVFYSYCRVCFLHLSEIFCDFSENHPVSSQWIVILQDHLDSVVYLHYLVASVSLFIVAQDLTTFRVYQLWVGVLPVHPEFSGNRTRSTMVEIDPYTEGLKQVVPRTQMNLPLMLSRELNLRGICIGFLRLRGGIITLLKMIGSVPAFRLIICSPVICR